LARLLVVSNRVDVPDEGHRPGGLAVALRATCKERNCVWLGWSGRVKPKDKVETRTLQHRAMTFIVTDLTKEDYREYYSGFANRVVWPILHYRIDLAEFSRRDLSGYLRVNEHFAREIDRVLQPDDVIWVHDYHLIPLAKALRDRGRTNRIGFFLHTPFPPPDVVTAMPNHERLIPSLSHYDLVGFQTHNDAANFARYLASECGFSQHIGMRISGSEHAMRIGVFPVGIETKPFATRARRAVNSAFVKRVLKSVPGVIMIGVDRLDYSKGITQRLEGYEKFLTAEPEWRGRVTYLQITPTSRSEIPEYVEIRRDIEAMAGRINGTYGDVSWTPVRYVNQTYSRTALAGLYRAARVGLVTPLRDGMNLVAKEYVAAQDENDPGVLVLSRFAGAAYELEAAILVNPYDSEAVGAAIAQALAMPREERIARQRELMQALSASEASSWGTRFLGALTGETEGDGPDGGPGPLPALAMPRPAAKPRFLNS
jgi:trehalose 6-phosphate synthase